ncbi:MAG: hypothetical protein DMG38_06440 [Acidobacteria bacterium]|nr:MAG: hypothetical protein DMG38_06440 [Acidobacteriota bacterium]
MRRPTGGCRSIFGERGLGGEQMIPFFSWVLGVQPSLSKRNRPLERLPAQSLPLKTFALTLPWPLHNFTKF